jgi:hypothetical protein
VITPSWVAASNFGENSVFMYSKGNSSQEWVLNQKIQKDTVGFKGFGFSLAASFCRPFSSYCLVIGSPYIFETLSKQDFERYGDLGRKSTGIKDFGGSVEIWVLDQSRTSVNRF